MKDVTLVLLAGGVSSRFDPINLKTLHKINGITLTELVINQVKTFSSNIVLVYNKNDEKIFKEIALKCNVVSVPGGKTRVQSALFGIKVSKTSKVIFIDVANPFFTNKFLSNITLALNDYDGVISGIIEKRADYIKVNAKNQVELFLERDCLMRLKSFQGVRKEAWIESIEKLTEEEMLKETEMIRALFKNNKKIGIVSLEKNVKKITTKNDLKLLKKIIEL